jgi:hypothetical protein
MGENDALVSVPAAFNSFHLRLSEFASAATAGSASKSLRSSVPADSKVSRTVADHAMARQRRPRRNAETWKLHPWKLAHRSSLRCRFHLFQSTTLTDARGQCLAFAPVRSVLARSGILAATLRRYSAGLSFVKRRKTSRKRRNSLKPHSEATRVNVRFRGSARSTFARSIRSSFKNEYGDDPTLLRNRCSS